MDALSTTATTSVFYADTVGVGVWGAGAKAFCKPSGWSPLIERLNGICLASKDAYAYVHGEYNAVFRPDECDASVRAVLPQLLDSSGAAVMPSEVVLRVTRPQIGVTATHAPFYRYRKLDRAVREMYYTLHGAVNGFAPACIAAVLFPALQLEDGTRLYGALYVLRRAQFDMNSSIDEQARKTEKRHGANQRQYDEAMRAAGRRLALCVLPVVCRQSKLGALSFDAKPGNYVFVNVTPQAIDFDACMYTLPFLANGAELPRTWGWHAALLMNLLFITAHVRCFHTTSVADGWVSALRTLIVDLCRHARDARWLLDARPRKRRYEEIVADDDDAQRRRFEMMVHLYFVAPQRPTGFRPAMGARTRCLLHQLVLFCIGATPSDTMGAQLDALFAYERGEK
jgi:hypothetical protein